MSTLDPAIASAEPTSFGSPQRSQSNSGLRLPRRSRLHRSGCRLRATPSASGNWPRPPGASSGNNMQPVKDAVVKKPAENVTLSAAEGEAMIARLSVYAPSRSDCEILIQVVRWYFWLAGAVQEAKLSLKKLRTLCAAKADAAHAVRACGGIGFRPLAW